MKQMPVKRRNVKRHAAAMLRAFGPIERREWMRAQPSVVDGATPCVSVHVKSGGKSRRADARYTVPMTWAQHQEMHNVGQATYARKHGLDLLDLAAETELKYRSYLSRQMDGGTW